MPKTNSRKWTAVEKRKLKGLAKKNVSVEGIARALARTVADTVNMGWKLGALTKESRGSDSEDHHRLLTIDETFASAEMSTIGYRVLRFSRSTECKVKGRKLPHEQSNKDTVTNNEQEQPYGMTHSDAPPSCLQRRH